MTKAGLWIELQAAVGFVLGLAIPHLQDLQRSVVGLVLAHLQPSGLPVAAALPPDNRRRRRAWRRTAARVGSSGHLRNHRLAGWTILGAWRMMTRDA